MSRARRPHHRISLRRLLRREEGGIATILAFVILPLMALAGLALDVSTAYWVYDRMRYALDGAALAAGHATDATQAGEDSERYFQANFEAGFVHTTLSEFSTSFDPTSGSVEVEATVRMPTAFMRLFGFQSLPISARAMVRRGGGSMELVMVLDTTGSMGTGGKIQALKDAATKMLDIMFAGRSEVDGLWVGAVPFASRVNVGRADWLAVLEPAGWPGCYDPRSGTNAVDDTPPAVEPFPLIGANLAGDDDDVDLAFDRCPDPRILPLTSTRSEIDALVDSLAANGRTNITYATSWGWRVISERWQGLWGDPQLPHLDGEVQKVVVLMTDGAHVPDPLIDSMSKAEMDAQLAQQCALMKAEGIVLYTIMFQAPGSLRPLFEGCASSPTHHFDLQHNDQLVEAFGAIGAELTELYLAE